MSRQSKMRNKRKARLAAKQAGPAKPRLTPEQKRLRREQARILHEARSQERLRQAAEKAAEAKELQQRRQREQERKLARTTKARSQTSSPTSADRPQPPVKIKGQVVSPDGTAVFLKGATVISRRGIHIKTYPAHAQVRFLGNGKQAVVILGNDQPPRMLDLETGQDRELEPILPPPSSVTQTQAGA